MRYFIKKSVFFLFNLKKITKLTPLYRVYIGQNPYRICRAVFKGGMFDGHVYGETPLYIYDFMGKFLKKGDLFVDLGCGRGKGLLYLCKHNNFQGLGFDLVESFIEKGNRIVKKMNINCLFKQENLLKIKLSHANAFYIAGTCMEDEVIFHLVKELSRVKAPLIFNLSFPLEDYGLKGYKTEEVSIIMPFGKTELYIHKKG